MLNEQKLKTIATLIYMKLKQGDYPYGNLYPAEIVSRFFEIQEFIDNKMDDKAREILMHFMLGFHRGHLRGYLALTDIFESDQKLKTMIWGQVKGHPDGPSTAIQQFRKPHLAGTILRTCRVGPVEPIGVGGLARFFSKAIPELTSGAKWKVLDVDSRLGEVLLALAIAGIKADYSSFANHVQVTSDLRRMSKALQFKGTVNPLPDHCFSKKVVEQFPEPSDYIIYPIRCVGLEYLDDLMPSDAIAEDGYLLQVRDKIKELVGRINPGGKLILIYKDYKNPLKPGEMQINVRKALAESAIKLAKRNGNIQCDCGELSDGWIGEAFSIVEQ